MKNFDLSFKQDLPCLKTHILVITDVLTIYSAASAGEQEHKK